MTWNGFQPLQPAEYFDKGLEARTRVHGRSFFYKPTSDKPFVHLFRSDPHQFMLDPIGCDLELKILSPTSQTMLSSALLLNSYLRKCIHLLRDSQPSTETDCLISGMVEVNQQLHGMD